MMAILTRTPPRKREPRVFINPVESSSPARRSFRPSQEVPCRSLEIYADGSDSPGRTWPA